MAHYFHYVKPENAPVKDLSRVLDHLWRDEIKDYAEDPTPRHLFHSLVAVANWLNGETTWTAEQYVAAWEASPDATWLSARGAATEDGATQEEATDSPPQYEVQPDWQYEGHGSRYRLKGHKPSVTVVVGWDRPLHTFFAQVWHVQEGATHHEQGKLRFWSGTDWNDVPTVDHLVLQLAPYAVLPDDLQLRLEADKLPETLSNLR